MSRATTRYIVDASIGIKWLFDDEDFTDEARSILFAFQTGSIDLLAPDHLYHETLNALRTGIRMRRISSDQATTAMNDFLELAVPTVDGPSLFRAGFDVSLTYDCAFYDGLYLALAEQARCPLLHADRRLHNTLRGRFASELWIGDYVV